MTITEIYCITLSHVKYYSICIRVYMHNRKNNIILIIIMDIFIVYDTDECKVQNRRCRRILEFRFFF